MRFLPTNVLQPTPAEGGVAQVGTADDVVFKILFKLLRRREASETQAHQIPATGGRRSKWDDRMRSQTGQDRTGQDSTANQNSQVWISVGLLAQLAINLISHAFVEDPLEDDIVDLVFHINV